ncbi:Histone-lysine N-methyltransferase SETMAR [Anthophora plagiata]
MVTIWWNAQGVIHYSFLQPGETITAMSYCREIDVMHEKLMKKQPALLNRHGAILLHDNARPHKASITDDKLTSLQYEILPHPPYSPDISPTDYYLFRNYELFLREKKYNNQNDIIKDFESFINSKNKDFFQKGIYDLPNRWQKVVDANGNYFN